MEGSKVLNQSTADISSWGNAIQLLKLCAYGMWLTFSMKCTGLECYVAFGSLCCILCFTCQTIKWGEKKETLLFQVIHKLQKKQLWVILVKFLQWSGDFKSSMHAQRHLWHKKCWDVWQLFWSVQQQMEFMQRLTFRGKTTVALQLLQGIHSYTHILQSVDAAVIHSFLLN